MMYSKPSDGQNGASPDKKSYKQNKTYQSVNNGKPNENYFDKFFPQSKTNGETQENQDNYQYGANNSDANGNQIGKGYDSNQQPVMGEYPADYNQEAGNGQYVGSYNQPFTGPYMQGGSLNQPEIDLKYYNYVNEFPRASNYNSWESICEVFPNLKNVNSKSFEVDNVKDCRAFIIRSNNEDDVHKAIKYGIWTSSPRNNEMLNKLYLETKDKDIPIYLFYSVVKSGQFVGVAQMTSEIQETSSNLWWEADKWLNQFEIKWVFIKDISYKWFSHVIIDGLPISRAKDCTRVPPETAIEMLKVNKSRPNHPNIFSAFEYMDYREDYLRSYKASLLQPQANTYSQFYQYNVYGMPQQYQTSNGKANGHQYFKYNSFPYESPQQAKKQDNTMSIDEISKQLSELELAVNGKDALQELDVLEEKAKRVRKHISSRLADTQGSKYGVVAKQSDTVKSLLKQIENLKRKPKDAGSAALQ